jgi:hypothetical protein
MAQLRAAVPFIPDAFNDPRLQQVARGLIEVCALDIPLAASFSELIQYRSDAIVRHLAETIYPIQDRLLGGLPLEDLLYPTVRELFRGRTNTEREMQDHGRFGSREYQGVYQALSTAAETISLSNRADGHFPEPRPGTNDIDEFEKLLRLEGLVGLEQYAASGRSELLGLFADNSRLLIGYMGKPLVHSPDFLWEHVLDNAAAVCAFAHAYKRFERNAQFRPRTKEILRGSETLISDLESLWPLAHTQTSFSEREKLTRNSTRDPETSPGQPELTRTTEI